MQQSGDERVFYAGPRRLSRAENRNSLKQVFGFSLADGKENGPYLKSAGDPVLEILPPYPPGPSGFTNDRLRIHF